MRKNVLRIALAAAAVVGAASPAQASLKILISDLTGIVTINSCDTSLAQSAVNCVGYAAFAIGANTVLFSGSVGDFTFANSIFSSNAPGTGGPFGSAFATTTNLNISSAAAAQTLKIDFTAFGFTQPAGSTKVLTGTSSQNGYASGGASTQSYGFYIDGTNSGLQTTGVTCGPVPLLNAGGGCDVTGPLQGIPGATFSLSDVATYFVALANDSFQASSTVTATAFVPEPASTALVGLALLAAGAAARRRKA